MKNFLLPKMWFEPIFFTGSLAVFEIAAKALNFGACCLAAVGGEMRSNYFQDTAPEYAPEYTGSDLIIDFMRRTENDQRLTNHSSGRLTATADLYR